jgi:hypothetical protein
MCLRRAPEKHIAGAALDRAGLDTRLTDGGKIVSSTYQPRFAPRNIIILLLVLISVRG